MVPAPREIRADPVSTALKLGGFFAVPMGLLFGLFGGVTGFVIGLPLGPCALITGAMGFAVAAVVFGGLSGVLFGGMMSAFIQGMLPAGVEPMDLEDAEALIVWGPGTHQRGLEGVGGTLSLTTRRLRFIPHAANLQTEPFSCHLSNISAARVGKSLGILRNRLLVTLPDAEHGFVVEEPQSWVDAVDEAIGGVLTQ